MSHLICSGCETVNSPFNACCQACGMPLSEAAGAVPAAGASWAGRVLGPYRLLGLLGSGAMGSVWRAEHRRSGQAVAVKTVQPVREDLLPRVRREIQALSRIRHPGIVRILGHGTEDGVPWYAMELFEGPTLREHIEAHRGAPLQARLTVVRRLCSALGYLHGEGLLHRDLKPENVILRVASSEPASSSEPEEQLADGRSLATRNSLLATSWPVLVDFGLAAEGSPASGREGLEVERGIAGTPSYMAPEQIRGELLDARADLYALGCILYELLTGWPPFRSASRMALLQSHLEAEPVPPSQVSAEIRAQHAASLDALVLRLLAKDPRDRLGYADDVAAALEALGAGNGWASTAPRPRAYLYRPALAGREDVLGVLEQRLAQLEAGRGALVLVGGESGVGKTRLLLEVARRAAGRQMRVLAGECLPGVASRQLRRHSQLATFESARAPRGRSDRSPSLPAGASGPLEVFRKPLQAVADRCRGLGVEETEQLLGRRGKVLAVYEPALRDLPGQDAYPEPAELPPDAARLRVYAYLAETLAAFGEGIETVLLLDDLQWADELTLGFLEYWLRLQQLGLATEGTRQTSPMLVVGAYRSEETGPGLEKLMSSDGTPSSTLLLHLGRLEAPAVGSMVGDMLALTPPPALFVRHLARHSEGNPFFVAEYLRAAVGEGLLFRDGHGRWQVADQGEEKATQATYEALPLPGSLRELVGRRLDGLGRSTRRVVDAAAVLGHESGLELLGPMLGLGESKLYEALDELLRRHVLEVSAPGRLTFLHDKIREVAYARLRKERRKSLHRAAAQSITGAAGLADAPPADQQSTLGHHWEQAGTPENARPCYLAAARHATARYDHAEAERLYRAYLRLVKELTPESVAARRALGCDVLFLRGRSEEAVAELHRSVDEARSLGDRPDEARGLRLLGGAYDDTGRVAQAWQLYEQALAIVQETGDRSEEGVVLGDMAHVHAKQGRPEQARQLTERALAVAREVGNRHSEGSMLGNLGVLHMEQGQPEQARQLYEQALAIHREVSNRRGEGHVLGNLGNLRCVQGWPEQGRQLLGQALAIHREVGNLRIEGLVLSSLGNLHREQGQMEQARQVSEQALAIACKAGDRRLEGVARLGLGIVYHEQGRLGQAQQLYEQALAIFRELGDKSFEGAVLGHLGNLHREQGRPELARQLYQGALAIFRELGDKSFEGDTVLSLMNLERITSGDLAKAVGLGAQSEELVTAAGYQPDLVRLLCGRGHNELAGGRSGRGLLERAQALAEDTGSGPDSELGKAVSKLRRACEPFEAGQHHRLFRGELIEDIPEGLRRWLRETGQLAPR